MMKIDEEELVGQTFTKAFQTVFEKINELIDENEALKVTIGMLENRNDDLVDRISAIETKTSDD